MSKISEESKLVETSYWADGENDSKRGYNFSFSNGDSRLVISQEKDNEDSSDYHALPKSPHGFNKRHIMVKGCHSPSW